MATSIEIKNQEFINGLNALSQKLSNPSPVLKAIGEDVVERMKQRFANTTGPDGVRWRPNSTATLMRYLQARGAFSKKTGKISAKGINLAISKKPLQGVTGDLARQLFNSVDGDSLTVGSSMVYAAMQHFGGSKGNFAHLWGDIPARPYFPVTPAGELYPAEANLIVERLRDYLLG